MTNSSVQFQRQDARYDLAQQLFSHSMQKSSYLIAMEEANAIIFLSKSQQMEASNDSG